MRFRKVEYEKPKDAALVIAKEFIQGICTFHHNTIPLYMVEAAGAFNRDMLNAEVEPVLKEFADAAIGRLK